MPELITSPIFLIIAAILGIFLIVAIIKGAFRLLNLDSHYRSDPYRPRYYDPRRPTRLVRESPQDDKVTNIATQCVGDRFVFYGGIFTIGEIPQFPLDKGG